MRRPEINAALHSIGHALAGEYPGDDVEAAHRAHSFFANVPRGGAVIAFSAKEMDVLWEALTNGAEGVLQSHNGRRLDQKEAFRQAANRIADAGRFKAPRF